MNHKILSCQILLVLACSYFQSGIVLASEHAESISSKVRRNEQGFSVAAVGDLRCGPEVNTTIKNINNQSVQLILALGDLSYQRESADCWFDIVAPVENMMKIVLGTKIIYLIPY